MGDVRFREISVVIRARDEATAALRSAGQSVNEFAGVGRLAAAAWVVTRGVELIGHTASVWKAAAEAREAVGSAVANALEAQLKVNNAVREAGAALPIVGRAFGAVFDAMANTDAIQKTIEGFRALGQSIKGAQQTAEDWARSNAVKALQLGGAAGSVLAGVGAEGEAAARQRKIEEAQQILRAAETQVRTAQKAFGDYTDSTQWLGQKWMPSAGFGEAAFGTHTALGGAVSAAEVLRTQAREGLQALQDEDSKARRLAWENVRQIADKEHNDRLLAGYKQAKELGDDQQRAAAEAARAQVEADHVIRDAQRRGFDATATDRQKQLRAIDDWYAEQKERWLGNATVLAALQDSFHGQRAAALARQKAEDDTAELEAWMNMIPEAAKLSLPGRVTAPLLEQRFLGGRGPGGQNLAVESNRYLREIAGELKRQGQRQNRPPERGTNVRIVN